MYSFATAEAGSSEQLWAWSQARGAVDEAADALRVAGAELLSLAVDTEWQSRGVAALHRRLIEFQERTAMEIGRLQGSEAELAMIGIS